MDKKLKQIYQAKIKQLKEEANIPKLGWDGKFTKPAIHDYKISLCTTIMDRLPGFCKQRNA